jgi:hypothetical protein
VRAAPRADVATNKISVFHRRHGIFVESIEGDFFCDTSIALMMEVVRTSVMVVQLLQDYIAQYLRRLTFTLAP